MNLDVMLDLSALRFRYGDYINIMTLVSLPSQVQVMSGSHSEIQHTRTTVT